MKRRKPLKRTQWKRKPKPWPKPKPTTSQSHAKEHRPKPKPKKNSEFYEQWCKSHHFCQCCGIGAELASFIRWPGLSTHHIVKAGRVHAATNLIRLCQRCHDLAEGLDTPAWLPNGTKFYFPKLRLAHILWLKRDREPSEYDPKRLREIHMRPLPDVEPPPAVFLAEWEARREGRLTAAESLLAASGFPGGPRELLDARMQPRASHHD